MVKKLLIIPIFLVFSMQIYSDELVERLKVQVHPKMSAIAVAFESPVILNSNSSRNVFFIKLNKASDLLQSMNIIESDFYNENSMFSNNGYVYLLNIEPGKYAVVAVQVPDGMMCYFNEDFIKATVVDVGEGEIVFMGKYQFKTAGGPGMDWSGSLPQAHQNHYRDLLRWHEDLLVITRIHGVDVTRPAICDASFVKVDRSEKEKKEFLKNAAKLFKNTQWEAMLDKMK